MQVAIEVPRGHMGAGTGAVRGRSDRDNGCDVVEAQYDPVLDRVRAFDQHVGQKHPACARESTHVLETLFVKWHARGGT